jgi:hypothetical protein
MTTKAGRLLSRAPSSPLGSKPKGRKPSRHQLRNRQWAREESALSRGKVGESADHSKDLRAVADAYAKENKLGKLDHDARHKVDPENAAKIARAYHDLKHDPDHPDVKRAYDALAKETAAQYDHLRKHGYKFTAIKPGQENPYKTSKDLVKDVRDNKHAHYFPTEQGFGSAEPGAGSDHPLLKKVKTVDGEMVANDLFRAVHDVFGHAKEGHSFGPNGEENAYHHHAQMYSPEARKALASETRGQNSWVNFGPHAEHNRTNPAKTVYADQKAGIMPDWAHGSAEKKPA